MNWKFSVICLTLSVMACGMSMPTESPESVNKAVLINTPQLSPAPVPAVNFPEKMTACGNWNVRESADPKSKMTAYVFSGNTITLTGVTATAPAPDYGTWVQIRNLKGGTGWINARALCEVDK